VGEFQCGTLSGSYPNFSGITPVVQNQDWNYDAMGNWLGFQSGALNQTRQFNNANEITSIMGPSGAVTPLYDPVGNMTTMPAVRSWSTAQTLNWDAWNRLVRVSEGSSTIAEYSYDALFRRVTKTVSDATRRLYYGDQWQILEEYVGSSASPLIRYWYGLGDINDIARRQRYSSGTTLQDDIYGLRDIMSVVALVNSSGVVNQRMSYDAVGNGRFLNSAFAVGSNAANWNLLFHAHYHDAETGLYQIRFRYYHHELGVWVSRDPIGENGGPNLFVAMNNNSGRFWDPDGGAPVLVWIAVAAAGAALYFYYPNTVTPETVEWKGVTLLSEYTVPGQFRKLVSSYATETSRGIVENEVINLKCGKECCDTYRISQVSKILNMIWQPYRIKFLRKVIIQYQGDWFKQWLQNLQLSNSAIDANNALPDGVTDKIESGLLLASIAAAQYRTGNLSIVKYEEEKEVHDFYGLNAEHETHTISSTVSYDKIESCEPCLKPENIKKLNEL
jgi:RHS repeat-associated protein